MSGASEPVAAWKPVSEGTDPEWEPPGQGFLEASGAWTVEFRGTASPRSALIAYAYAARRPGTPGGWEVLATLERIVGEDPDDPVGSETWSDSVTVEIVTGGHLDAADAELGARSAATLLRDCNWESLATSAGDLHAAVAGWDGQPYQLEPAAAGGKP